MKKLQGKLCFMMDNATLVARFSIDFYEHYNIAIDNYIGLISIISLFPKVAKRYVESLTKRDIAMYDLVRVFHTSLGLKNNCNLCSTSASIAGQDQTTVLARPPVPGLHCLGVSSSKVM